VDRKVRHKSVEPKRHSASDPPLSP
jgi:hypothetical protein